ncbi:MAG: hypothetical protein JEZ08_18940 [Clostridiales bacterium]|nr:hypothetical protein [Clostridiales bacterium]
MGFKLVGEADNGVEALEIIDKENLDLAPIDIKMSYMDGIYLSQITYNQYLVVKLSFYLPVISIIYHKVIRYCMFDYTLNQCHLKRL